MPQPAYRGRFAPSPTGPLHFGSLVAALGSYLEARKAGGQWLVRIEDLDPPREVPGAAAGILRSLERLGFAWDEAVLYQSTRAEFYEAALRQLITLDLAYPCSCTRSELQVLMSPAGLDGDELRYPGICQAQPRRSDGPYAYRFRVPAGTVRFFDELQGEIAVDLEHTIGDFVVKRRDGLFAYQLAVVVDDAAQGITHVVRGADLLLSTPRQLILQRALGIPTPHYTHLPLATDAAGQKFSKATHATAIDDMPTQLALWKAATFLGLQAPAELQRASLRELWEWTLAHWSLQALIGVRGIAVVT